MVFNNKMFSPSVSSHYPVMSVRRREMSVGRREMIKKGIFFRWTVAVIIYDYKWLSKMTGYSFQSVFFRDIHKSQFDIMLLVKNEKES